MWAIFYEEIDAKDRLPRILTDRQVARLGSELACFHKACLDISVHIPPASKTAKSDAVNLFEQTARATPGNSSDSTAAAPISSAATPTAS